MAVTFRPEKHTFYKDPQEKLDYQIDYTNLLLDSETISVSEWTVDAALTLSSESIAQAKATVWIAGGVAGTTYKVENKITTSSGRIFQESIYIKVVDK